MYIAERDVNIYMERYYIDSKRDKEINVLNYKEMEEYGRERRDEGERGKIVQK